MRLPLSATLALAEALRACCASSWPCHSLPPSSHTDLQANLGDGYLDTLSSVTAEELNNIGAFFSTKPVTSVLHEADLWMKVCCLAVCCCCCAQVLMARWPLAEGALGYDLWLQLPQLVVRDGGSTGADSDGC